MNYLQDTQKEAIANYQAITETWDDEQAVEILRKHDWDVTKASNYFFTGDFERIEPQGLMYMTSEFQSRPRRISWEKRINSFFSNIWRAIVPEEIRGENSKSALNFSSKIAGVNPSLSFSSLQFQELLLFSQENDKRIFVILSQDDEQIIECFRDPNLTEILNREYICWGVNYQSKDGEVLKTQLKIEEFPFAMILKVEDPKRPGILDRISGLLTSERLLRFIEKQSQFINPYLLIERELRERQQEELKQAELIAIARENERKQAEDRRREEQERIEKEKSDRKAYLHQKLEIEPDSSSNPIQVSFKLPSGKRIDRAFASSDQVQNLYDYLEYTEIKVEDLLTGFPPQSLTNKDLTLEEAGLHPRCVIHVREPNN